MNPFISWASELPCSLLITEKNLCFDLKNCPLPIWLACLMSSRDWLSDSLQIWHGLTLSHSKNDIMRWGWWMRVYFKPCNLVHFHTSQLSKAIITTTALNRCEYRILQRYWNQMLLITETCVFDSQTLSTLLWPDSRVKWILICDAECVEKWVSLLYFQWPSRSRQLLRKLQLCENDVSFSRNMLTRGSDTLIALKKTKWAWKVSQSPASVIFIQHPLLSFSARGSLTQTHHINSHSL